MEHELAIGRAFAKSPGVPRTIAILLYPHHTMQDWVGPYCGINALAKNDLNIVFVAKQRGPVKDERGRGCVEATHSFAEVSAADVLIVPGGVQQMAMQDGATLDWVRQVHATTEHTVTVCSGGIILAATGALRDMRVATVYWAREALAAFGAIYSPASVTEDGKLISAAGVSGGVEAGLRLAERLSGRLFAEAMQLMMQYTPSPVLGTGDVETAPAAVHERVLQILSTDDLFVQARGH